MTETQRLREAYSKYEAEQELLAVAKKRLAAVEKEHMASERRQRNTTMAGPALPARPGAMPKFDIGDLSKGIAARRGRAATMALR